ncbi:MAG TPA: HlyD family efflux transporter periplasmic adaptor subunit [Puia sp.]|nr:HlyD family efflux transporter periplasmic adaptor subunit [Puia sp.]
MTSYLRLLLLASALSACSRPQQVHLSKKDIIETVYASGKITSSDEYTLFAFSNGAIRKKLVKDGDTVRKGQLLYIVEHDAADKKYEAALTNYRHSAINLSETSPLLNDLRLAVQNAEIRQRNDSLTYFRWKNLWDEGIGTRTNLDNAYTNYQMSVNLTNSATEKYASALYDVRLAMSNAGSQLQSSRKELDDYLISSDRDGVVYQTLKEAGEGVRTGEPVALIGAAGQRIIRLAVDQEDVNSVRIGQKVVLRTDLTGNMVYQARVTRIYPTMNEVDQTFRVDATFDGDMPQPFIHGSVEANIIIRVKTSATVLPHSAMADDDSVWIFYDGKEKKVAVRTGITSPEYVEILNGLDENTPVLLKTKSSDK